MRDDFYYISKDYNYPDEENPEKEISEKRESIIQLAEIKGINEFYKELNLIFNKQNEQFEAPFAHITLFTNSTREERKSTGIGIYSQEQFEEMKPRKI